MLAGGPQVHIVTLACQRVQHTLQVVVLQLHIYLPSHTWKHVSEKANLARGGPASKNLSNLVAPYRAILRYYRCDTPYRAILFQGGSHSRKMVRYPPLVLSFTQAHLCDTPFCNVSRDNCAIPHKNMHEKVLRYYRYKYRAIWKVSLLGL